MKKSTISIICVTIAAFLVTAGIVYAASSYNVTSRLGGVAGDYFDLDGTLTVDSLKVGLQSVGGVTFFNGTIVNNTTNATGADNPVTFGDNVRIDGSIHRGILAGTGDNQPVKINDDLKIMGNLTLDGSLTLGNNQTVTFGTSSVLNVTNATITGLSSDDLSDVNSIAMLDEAETITGNWVNVTNPWAANEIADITRRVEITLGSLFTDADGTPAAITSATTPNLVYTANQGLFLEYAEDDTTDFGGQVTVPSDYASGGVFKAIVDTSAVIVTDWNLDFKLAISESVNTPAWATAMANETPVDVPSDPGKPHVITFTPTNQSSISAGDVIFFDIFPDSNTATGEPNVEIYSVWFEYTAIQ